MVSSESTFVGMQHLVPCPFYLHGAAQQVLTLVRPQPAGAVIRVMPASTFPGLDLSAIEGGEKAYIAW